MDEKGLRLLKIGFYGMMPMLVLSYFLGGGWTDLCVVPFLLCIALPIKREIKGILASFNHGVEPDIKAKNVLKSYTRLQTWLYMIPLYSLIKQTAYNTRVWKLNRKPRTLKQHFMKLKPVALDNDGNHASITSWASILTISVISWLVMWVVAQLVLKFNSTNCFYFSSILATTVLGSLIALYVKRRIRKQIVKHSVKPSPWGKYAFTTMSCFFIGLLLIMNFLWQFSVAGMLLLVVFLVIVGMNLVQIRKRGWNLDKWSRPTVASPVKPSPKFHHIHMNFEDPSQKFFDRAEKMYPHGHLEWNEDYERWEEK